MSCPLGCSFAWRPRGPLPELFFAFVWRPFDRAPQGIFSFHNRKRDRMPASGSEILVSLFVPLCYQHVPSEGRTEARGGLCLLDGASLVQACEWLAVKWAGLFLLAGGSTVLCRSLTHFAVSLATNPACTALVNSGNYTAVSIPEFFLRRF
jgi:hypothetical protein